VWPVSVQCRVLEVSVSGYHQHRARLVFLSKRRHLTAEVLLVRIRAVHAENRGAYGWPRVWRSLRTQGVRVCKRSVQRLHSTLGYRSPTDFEREWTEANEKLAA